MCIHSVRMLYAFSFIIVCIIVMADAFTIAMVAQHTLQCGLRMLLLNIYNLPKVACHFNATGLVIQFAIALRVFGRLCADACCCANIEVKHLRARCMLHIV